MSIFKCKLCGGNLEIENGQSVAVCEYCGTKQTLPRLDNDKKENLYERAGHYRRNNDFDKAMNIYEQILNEDNTDAEAYWSILLCRYGIKYVEDPQTKKRLPTVNRAQYGSIFDNEDYKSAVKYADAEQREIYEEEAKVINEIQKGILAISQREEPFDVFICYKESDSQGKRTQDSVIATELYHELTREGFKVFFARITLEDKLGVAYEPYIFAALNSAKVMVVLGTKAEHFNAVWVKNEWSRFLAIIKNGEKKVIIPAYRDMDPYDLPEEFSHLQAQDMGKLGFMQDLIHGIKKIVSGTNAKPKAKDASVAATVAPLIRRALIFMEDGNAKAAHEYVEKVLDADPENADAYIVKLMMELGVWSRSKLGQHPQPFNHSNNYLRAMRYADSKQKAELEGYIKEINDRNENARLDGMYNYAMQMFHMAYTASGFESAAARFEEISGYKDSAEMAGKCMAEADSCRRETAYRRAKEMGAGIDPVLVDKAAKELEALGDYKDSVALATEYRQIAQKIREKQEQERIENERLAEERRIKSAKRKKRIILFSSIGGAVAVIAAVFVVLLFMLILPTMKYNSAKDLMAEGNYAEAYEILIDLNFKDSDELAKACESGWALEHKYETAVSKMQRGDYEEAIDAFTAIIGYKDSQDQIAKCYEMMNDEIYEEAVQALEDGDYSDAINLFTSLNGYKDASEKILKAKYAYATSELDKGRYESAIEMFQSLDKYSDSVIMLSEAKYRRAVEAMNSGDYASAMGYFAEIKSYKDSASKLTTCQNNVSEQTYQMAKSLINSNKYSQAAELLKALGNYKDSAEIVSNWDNTYNQAVSYRDVGNYDQAILLFNSLYDYRDSASQAETCVEFNKEVCYDRAWAWYSLGKYEDALALFKTLGNYKDSASYVTKITQELDYKKGVEYISAKKYEEAIEIFTRLGSFKDSADQLNKAKYGYALQLYKADKYCEAAKMYLSLGNYLDSATRAYMVWDAVAKRDVIAAGESHVVMMDMSGSVWSAGNSSNGQCATSALTASATAIAVSAGSNFTAALLDDYTVRVVGNVSTIRNDVMEWSGIVAIDAGGAHIVGLKVDGTVVAAGNNSNGKCNTKSSWTDIIAVSAGESHTVVLRSDGTVDAIGDNTYGQCNVSGWTNIVAISAGKYHTVGIRDDGTVVAAGGKTSDEVNVSGLKNIVSIEAGDSITVCLDKDKNVYVRGNSYTGLKSMRKVISVAVGSNNVIVITESKELTIFGSDSMTQKSSGEALFNSKDVPDYQKENFEEK